MSKELAVKVQALLQQPGVTDVLINGTESVWIDKGAGLEQQPSLQASGEEIRDLAVRWAALAGRRLDDAVPVVDARLVDGTRLHAILPPLVDGDTHISLRRLRSEAFSMDDLVYSGMLSGDLATILAKLVQKKASILIAGATGSGKTTLLSALLSVVDIKERLVVVEEAGEVSPNHPHLVRLIERRVNVDGAGAFSLAELVKQSLRMRPDRLVLGECRGAEVADVLVALNTEHRGGLATIHANSLADVPARLLALGALANLSPQTLVPQAQAAFQVILQLERDSQGRKIAQLGFLRNAKGTLRVVKVLELAQNGAYQPTEHFESWRQLWRL